MAGENNKIYPTIRTKKADCITAVGLVLIVIVELLESLL